MKGAPIRVLLVDDQALFREGVSTILSVRNGLEVVGEARDGEAALSKAAELRPDVVLMDLRMPKMGGVEATRRLAESHPGIKVVALTTFDDDELVFEALRAGATGYLLKDASGDELVGAIRAAYAGGASLAPSVASRVIAEFSRLTEPAAQQSLADPLSQRELEVLRLLAGGSTNGEIARRLYLAEGTVKNHLTSILRKLGARDRTQAALRARALGLV